MKNKNEDKIMIDLNEAIERVLDKRSTGVSSVAILTDDAGRRVEFQSSNEKLDTLIDKAHNSISKLKGNNGKTEGPGYTG